MMDVLVAMETAEREPRSNVGRVYLIYAHLSLQWGALHFRLCIDRTGEIRVLQHGGEIRL